MPCCQICLEEIPPKQKLITRLCGPKCPAKICQLCLEQHLKISFKSIYTGFLPKVHCPICLTLLHKTHWIQQVRRTQRCKFQFIYEQLCAQACMFTPPCCHKDTYTHLPELHPYYQSPLGPLKLLPSKVTQFRRLCRQFCRHKLDARSVLDYVLVHFGETKAATVVSLTLRKIYDEERRATLLLSWMHLRPNTFTNCCNFAICFNCKRVGHHTRCDNDNEAVNEKYCVVRCRGCRAMLLKVEGCDSVACPCGFQMSWAAELEYRQLYKRGLVPVDMFNQKVFDSWNNERGRRSILNAELLEMYFTHREQRFYKWFDTQKPRLCDLFTRFVCWRRVSGIMVTMLRELRWKTNHLAMSVEEVEVMEELFAIDI